jgi:serine/threonine protein phosphatase PrpC
MAASSSNADDRRAPTAQVARLRVHATAFVVGKVESEPPDDVIGTESYEDGLFLAVLADGMGGAKQGREAAARAVNTFTQNLRSRPQAWPLAKTLEELTKQLNRLLYQEGMARFDQPELGTTLAAVALEGSRLHAINAGDSRIYLYRSGRFEQLSQDHRSATPGQEHHLVKALGAEEEVTPYYTTREVAVGDLLLLCSDGLSDVLDTVTLQALLEEKQTARAIVLTARERATPEQLDDVSTILLEVLETGSNAGTPESLPVAGPLKAGDVVDGFTLRRSFRASDRVWLASRAGHSYVLKFAPAEAKTNEALLTQFVREIWHATRLQAEYFPAAFLPEPCTYRYYAQEYIHAPNLRQYLQDHGNLSVEETVQLGRFLLAAMQYLVRHDFVHGDLKPENIIVIGNSGELCFKLIDLGSVAEVFSFNRRAGTPSYLAPERFQGAASSEASETFAIGVTLYEALTGKLPYGEIEPFQTPIFRTARPPSSANALVPLWLDAVVLRALAIKPADRYVNYSEMLFELEHPEKVRPFHRADASLLERDPLNFYRRGFFFLLAVVIVLLLRLLK